MVLWFFFFLCLGYWVLWDPRTTSLSLSLSHISSFHYVTSSLNLSTFLFFFSPNPLSLLVSLTQPPIEATISSLYGKVNPQTTITMTFSLPWTQLQFLFLEISNPNKDSKSSGAASFPSKNLIVFDKVKPQEHLECNPLIEYNHFCVLHV